MIRARSLVLVDPLLAALLVAERGRCATNDTSQKYGGVLARERRDSGSSRALLSYKRLLGLRFRPGYGSRRP